MAPGSHSLGIVLRVIAGFGIVRRVMGAAPLPSITLLSRSRRPEGVAPREVRTRVSIRRERMPPPGVREKAWAWDDVLQAPPPSEARARQEGALVVRHGFDEDPDAEARLGYVTLVEASDGIVRVDERVVVEPRVLAPVLRAERVVSRQLERTSRASVRIVTSTTTFVGTRVGGRSGEVVQKGGGLVARGLSWVDQTVREGLRSVVEAPDRLFAGADSAGAHLRARRERGLFLRGLLDPHRLTREGKAAALVLALGAVVALGIVASLGVVLFAPEWARAWRALLSYFGLGLGSTLLFPFFPELTFATVAEEAGVVPAILAVTLGMTVGGWLVLFLGEGIHGALRKSVTPGSPVERFLDRAEALATRHGFWLAFGVLAVPYGPDTPVFYVLASVRTPTAKYVAGTFLGVLTRFTLLQTLFLSGLVPRLWDDLARAVEHAWPW